MKRHEALIPLTHDHHHALAQVRRLKTAALDASQRTEATRDFLHFYSGDTLMHFREEEEVVFPMLIGAEQDLVLLERALMEHQEIHAAVKRLARESRDGAPTESTMKDVATRLEAHIRFEEKQLFPLIEQAVPDAELSSTHLAARSRTSS